MRRGRAKFVATTLIVSAAIANMAAQGPATAGPYTADILRDLPLGANLYSMLEAAQPEVITDGFNSGGLNGGRPARAGAFLASWNQTQYRLGDLSLSSPVDGAPLLFPESAWWNAMQVTTTLMPIGATAPGLLVSLEPRRAATKWSTTIEGSGSGGGFTQSASSTRPPPITQLNDWAHATGVTSGPAMGGRLGVVAGGSWRRGSRLERAGPTRLREETGSAFASAAFSLSSEREVRGLAWVQSARAPFAKDRAVHTQATLEHRRSDSSGWRVFAGSWMGRFRRWSKLQTPPSADGPSGRGCRRRGNRTATPFNLAPTPT
jgi:hypothetical protein